MWKQKCQKCGIYTLTTNSNKKYCENCKEQLKQSKKSDNWLHQEQKERHRETNILEQIRLDEEN